MPLSLIRSLSLSQRLLLAATLVLAAFLTLTGLALNTLYEKRAYDDLKTQLLGHVYTLLSAAEDDVRGHMVLPEVVPDPRFNRPDSGLYASVSNSDKTFKWQSASMLGQNLKLETQARPGETLFQKLDTKLLIHFGLAWDDLDGNAIPYRISIATELTAYEQNAAMFRQGLFKWLGGGTLILLLVQLLVLHWGLRPLKQAATDIKRIESGELDKLEGQYPKELQGLTGNLNSLIEHGIANQQRYRNSLGDLAHSLKTPLALLQGALDADDNRQIRSTLTEQLPRVDDLVQYHLQRASVMGRASLAQAVELKPVVNRILSGLKKVYADKNINAEVLIEDNCRFFGDLSDLMELLGNLLDNACKYGHGKILIKAADESGLILSIEDNGPGITASERERLLRRGERADQQKPGQGIGLSVVNEIVLLYKARLEINQSDLGGACFVIHFRPGG